MAHDNDLDIDIPELSGDDDDPQQWQPGVELDLGAAEAAGLMAGSGPEAPPERVRFMTPAVIICEEDRHGWDGATLNLSVRGVAVVTTARLRAGERVWAEFRLGLGEEPLSLLCAVIWSGPEAESGRLYGLQFVSLTQEEQAGIEAAVRERSEGRAAEWSLPVMPSPQPSPPHHGSSPWLSAAAGMAAGIGLALALSAIPKAGVSGPPPMVPAPAAYASVEAGSASGGVTETTQESAPAGAALAAQDTEAVQAAAFPAAGPAGAQLVATAAATTPPAAHESELPRTVVKVPAETTPAARGQGGLLPRRDPAPAAGAADDMLRPLGTEDGVELALLVDGPADEHVSFWLDNPRRLVVDVYGRKSGFSRTSYGIQHPLASQLRVGQHPDKVRFVVETAVEVASEVRTRPSDTGLILELARR